MFFPLSESIPLKTNTWSDTHGVPNVFAHHIYLMESKWSLPGAKGCLGLPKRTPLKKKTAAFFLVGHADHHMTGGMWSSRPSTLITGKLLVSNVSFYTTAFILVAFCAFSEDKTDDATCNANQWAARRELLFVYTSFCTSPSAAIQRESDFSFTGGRPRNHRSIAALRCVSEFENLRFL